MVNVDSLGKQLKEQLFVGIERKKLLPSGSYQERLLNLLPVTEFNKDERVICITLKANRTLCIRKLKKHKNSYEVTKSWKLHEIKEIVYEDPLLLKLTLTRKYVFQTDNEPLTRNFVAMLINFCQKYTSDPPHIIDRVMGASGKANKTTGGGGGGSIQLRAASISAPTTTGIATPAVINPRKTFRQTSRIASIYNAVAPATSNPPRRSSLMFTSRSQQQQQQQQMPSAVSNQLSSQTYYQQRQQIQRQVEIVHGHPTLSVEEGEARRKEVEIGAETAEGEAISPADAADDGFDNDFLLDQEFMLSTEELQGKFEWRANIDADELEAKLVNEMARLESEVVQAMLESDQYVPSFLEKLDVAISKLDMMDQLLLRYSDELESMGDDVRKIRVENETLKIEEHNQKRLLEELDQALRHMALSESDLSVLRNEPLKTEASLKKVQYMAARLQRMLGNRYDGQFQDMGGARAALERYHMASVNFTSRVYEYLRVMIQAETSQSGAQADSGLSQGIRKITLPESIHEAISMYTGLILWLKNVNAKYYKDIQALYVQSMNTVFKQQVSKVMDSCPYYSKNQAEPSDRFNLAATNRIANSLPGRRSLDHQPISSSGGPPQATLDNQPSEEFSILLDTVMTNVICESNFITDFFHYVSDTPSLFYDWTMNSMEPIGNRKVARPKNPNNNQGTVVKGILDLTFSDLATRIDAFVRVGTKEDPLQSVGMLDEVEKWRKEVDGTSQLFAIELLRKLRLKLLNIFNSYIMEQVQLISQAKLTAKKRTGVAPFVHVFPNSVSRLENLIGGTVTPARSVVNQAYDHISAAMFKALTELASAADQHVAQNANKDAEKEKINASILLVINADVLISGFKSINYAPTSTIPNYLKEAQSMYDTHMKEYIRLLLNRPLGKVIDFIAKAESTKKKAPAADLEGTPYGNKALQVLFSQHKPKTVKEGLRAMFKRIDKHMEETPHLRPVVYSHAKAELHDLQEWINGFIAANYPSTAVRTDLDTQDLFSHA